MRKHVQLTHDADTCMAKPGTFCTVQSDYNVVLLNVSQHQAPTLIPGIQAPLPDYRVVV